MPAPRARARRRGAALLSAALGLASAACEPSSPDDTSQASDTSGTASSSGTTDASGTTSGTTSEPTSGGDPGYVPHACGAADDVLLPHQFDAEPDCNVVLGGLHLSDQSFTDLTAIGRLRLVHGTLSFFRNESLTSMHGLEALESIGDLLVQHHPVLVDLRALARLVEIPGEVYIAHNAALDGLQGLENVQSVGSLAIVGNARLSSLVGLAGLRRVDGDLTIRDNPKLLREDAEAFVAGLEVGGAIEVLDNGP